MNSFLFLSKGCTPSILGENFPGRGGDALHSKFSERKSAGHLMIQKHPRSPCIHLHPLFCVFVPPTSTWHWVTSLRTHTIECFLWLKKNSIQTTCIIRIMGLMSQAELVLRTQSFCIGLKRGWHSQWSCVGERSREFPSPFSQILHTRIHAGRFFGPWCTRGPDTLPQTSTSKILVCRNTCVAFPWNRIFSSHKSAFF